jgi:molybdopterin molybdotransferase
MDGEGARQKIARLTPVDEVLAQIERLIRPVTSRPTEVAAAVGRMLAEDAIAPANCPRSRCALRDGFAVSAESVADASAYAPVPFASPPPWVDAGEELPAATDVVLPHDAVVQRNSRFEAIAPVTPGEGTLAAGADARAGEPLVSAERCLSATDVAVLRAAGVDRVATRVPRIRLARTHARDDLIIEAIHRLLVRAILTDGGVAQIPSNSAPADDLVPALADQTVDAVIAVGGTGNGRHDASVRTLVQHGRVVMHGIALMPGDTAAFGLVGTRPVLLVPGRLDAALAVWLVIGRHLLARLIGHGDDHPEVPAVLKRKISSPLGMTEVVPVRRTGSQVEPVASGYWPHRAIAQSDGWVLVPAHSEGYPAGAQVMVRPWP